MAHIMMYSDLLGRSHEVCEEMVRDMEKAIAYYIPDRDIAFTINEILDRFIKVCIKKEV